MITANAKQVFQTGKADDASLRFVPLSSRILLSAPICRLQGDHMPARLCYTFIVNKRIL